MSVLGPQSGTDDVKTVKNIADQLAIMQNVSWYLATRLGNLTVSFTLNCHALMLDC